MPMRRAEVRARPRWAVATVRFETRREAARDPNDQQGDQPMRPLTSLVSSWKSSTAMVRNRAGRPRPGEAKATSKRRRPRVEALESRALLSTITVNSFADSQFVAAGQTTLR